MSHVLYRDDKKGFLELRRQDLCAIRDLQSDIVRTIADYVRPRRTRLFGNVVNSGQRRNDKILVNTATLASRTWMAGMMSGNTSPARPWFRLGLENKRKGELWNVKRFLHNCTRTMLGTFGRSNFYQILPEVYRDLGDFGMGAKSMERDYSGKVHRSQSFPYGSYFFDVDPYNDVNQFGVDRQLSVIQMIEEYGVEPGSTEVNWNLFSPSIRQLYKEGSYNAYFNVCQFVYPNPDYREGGTGLKGMKWLSCHWERGAASSDPKIASGQDYMKGPDRNKYLRESGYRLFPFLVPRWEVNGEDIMPCDWPGLTCLGDNKQRQFMERKRARAMDKHVDPTMVGPDSLRGQNISHDAARMNYQTVENANQGMRPIHVVDPKMTSLEVWTQEVEARIKEAYYVPLFLSVLTYERGDMTAREVEERHSEKMAQLGPNLERFNWSTLDKAIDLSFAYHLEADLFEDVPEELEGEEIKVEYISAMAQAAKLSGLSTYDRVVDFSTRVMAATQDPSTLDAVNFDKLMIGYQDEAGLPPDITRTEDEIAEVRAGRQQQAAQAAMPENLKNVAGAAKDLAQAPMDAQQPNALTELMRRAQAGGLTPTP